MSICTVIFTYNRPKHTDVVLKALRDNTVLPEQLLIFHDGKKEETDNEAWNKVENIINSVEWCNCEVITCSENKGLANSVLEGISYAFKRYDAVIVLEDDCVPHILFMEYMTKCLEKYASNDKVHSISGYAWPIDIEKDEDEDVYACGRVCSYGWGTWKNRWENFECDYNMLKGINSNDDTSLYLARWGCDLENMLISNLIGRVDSWAVFWALDAILKKQICINPYYSLINNIGFDGSGIHSIVGESLNGKLEQSNEKDWHFPENIDIKNKIVKAFKGLYGSNIVDGNDELPNAVVYGLGSLYNREKNRIAKNYNIVAFVDNYRRGYLEGKKIIKLSHIKEFYDCKIVVAILNKESAKKAISDIGVPSENIVYVDEIEN